jgi:hypothetical protein
MEGVVAIIRLAYLITVTEIFEANTTTSITGSTINEMKIINFLFFGIVETRIINSIMSTCFIIDIRLLITR